MHKDVAIISPRAMAIARGLAVTGPAGEAVVVGNWLKAQARRGDRRESCYIDIAAGARLLRGIGQRTGTWVPSRGFASRRSVQRIAPPNRRRSGPAPRNHDGRDDGNGKPSRAKIVYGGRRSGKLLVGTLGPQGNSREAPAKRLVVSHRKLAEP
jgi:hypothetical protein